MSDLPNRALLVDAADRAATYLEGLETRNVSALPGAVEALIAGLQEPLPDGETAPEAVLDLIDRLGSPATVASAGGRYFGFVTGGTLPAALAAHVLAGAWDQNAFSWISSPAVAAFEEVSLQWVKQALGISLQSEGAIVTGATMANFTCLAAARNRVLNSVGWDVDSKGLFGAPDVTVFVGDEAHATLFKVLSMLGMGRDRVHRLPTDDQGRIIAADLPAIDGPAILCLQAGNVNSGSFDPAEPLIEWAHGHGAWVHVDGAFGLWALACQPYAHLAAGYQTADSWATDAHKWLNVPYDSGIALVADGDALRQAMSISGAYIAPSSRRDAIDVTPDSSRRSRAIELWAALKSLGRSGLSQLIERNCRQAEKLAAGLRQAGFEILNDVVLNQIIVAFGDDACTGKTITAIQDEGTCWCSGTLWQGRAAMRVSFSSWATTDSDVDRTLSAIIRTARSVAD